MAEGCIAAGVLAIAWLGAIQGDRYMFGLPVWEGTLTSLVKPPATPIHPSKALYSAREAGSGHSLSSGSTPTSRVSSSSATSALSSLIDWEMAAAVIMVIGLCFLLYYGMLEYLEEENPTDSKIYGDIYGDKGTNTEPEQQRTDLDAVTDTQSDPKSYAEKSTDPGPEDSRIYVDKGTNTEPEQQRTGLDAVTDTQSDPKSCADKSTGPKPEERATSVDAGTRAEPDLRDEVLHALRKDNNKKATHILDLAPDVEKVEKEMESLQGELRAKRDRIRLLEQEISTRQYDGRSTLDELRHRVELIVLDSDGWEEYNNAFPNGHETIATSSRGLWCGLYAVIRTLEAMHFWIDRPTIEDLLATFNSADRHSVKPSSGGGSKGDGNGLEGERSGQAMHNSFPSATANNKAPNTTQGTHPLPPKPPTPAWFTTPKADTASNATVPTGLPIFQQPKPTYPLPSRIPNPTNALPRTTQATAKPTFAGQGWPKFIGGSVGEARSDGRYAQNAPNGQPAGPDTRTGHPPGFKSDIHFMSTPPTAAYGLPARPPMAADTMFGFGGFRTPAAATGAKSDQPESNPTSPPSPPAECQNKDDEATKTSPPHSAEDHQGVGEKPEERKGNTDTKGAAPAKQDHAAVRKGEDVKGKPENVDDDAKGDEADIKEESKNDGGSEKRDDGDDDGNETVPLEGEKPKRKRRRKKRTGRGKDMTPEEWNARAEEEKKDAGA